MNSNTVVSLLLKRKKLLIILIGISIGSAVIQSIISVMPGYIINSVVYLKSVKTTYKLLLMYSLIVFLNLLIAYLKNILIINEEFYLREEMIRAIFGRLFESDILEIRRFETTYLTQRVFNDINFIAKFFVGCLSTSFSLVIICGISFIVMGKINCFFAVITVLSIPLYIYYIYSIRKKINKINLELKESKDKYISIINNQVKLIDVIKLNNLKTAALDLIETAFNSTYTTSIKTYKMNFGINFFENNITLLIRIIFFAVGTTLIIDGKLSYGFFTVTMSLYSILVSNFKYFLTSYKEWLETKVSFKRLDEIYMMKKSACGKKMLNTIFSMSTKEGKFLIASDRILEYPETNFVKGEVYWIRGSNGVGKTTFFNVITGLYYSGELETSINYEKLDDLNMDYVRSIISYVQQEPQFWDMSVKENVSFYLQKKMKYDEFKSNLISKGIDEIVGTQFLTYALWKQKATDLSLGQKKKLMLCIQLVKKSCVLLLDEPNAALDIDSIVSLKNWINKNRNKYITLIISHDTEYSQMGAIEIYL